MDYNYQYYNTHHYTITSNYWNTVISIMYLIPHYRTMAINVIQISITGNYWIMIINIRNYWVMTISITILMHYTITCNCWIKTISKIILTVFHKYCNYYIMTISSTILTALAMVTSSGLYFKKSLTISAWSFSAARWSGVWPCWKWKKEGMKIASRSEMYLSRW